MPAYNRQMTDHMVRFTRASGSVFCILEAIKNWSQGRPGNEATGVSVTKSILQKFPMPHKKWGHVLHIMHTHHRLHPFFNICNALRVIGKRERERKKEKEERKMEDGGWRMNREGGGEKILSLSRYETESYL